MGLALVMFLLQETVKSPVPSTPSAEAILQQAAPRLSKAERLIWKARALAAEAELARQQAQAQYMEEMRSLEKKLKDAGHLKEGCEIVTDERDGLALKCPAPGVK